MPPVSPLDPPLVKSVHNCKQHSAQHSISNAKVDLSIHYLALVYAFCTDLPNYKEAILCQINIMVTLAPANLIRLRLVLGLGLGIGSAGTTLSQIPVGRASSAS